MVEIQQGRKGFHRYGLGFMGKKAISVENVSKIYRLGEIGTGTLSSDVNRWWVTKVFWDGIWLKVV